MIGRPAKHAKFQRLLGRPYLAKWARERRAVELPPHEYTGKQNHCRRCYNEYMRINKLERLRMRIDEIEPHQFVSYWHCRKCKSWRAAQSRRDAKTTKFAAALL